MARIDRQETAPNREFQHRAENSDTSRDRGLSSEFARGMSPAASSRTVMGFKPDPLIVCRNAAASVATTP
jgi:hypothetical protein